MRFGILCEATDPTVEPMLATIAHALMLQTAEFGSWWETTASVVELLPNAINVPALDILFHIKDSIPEAPDALAYHTTDQNGRPVLVLGWETIKQNGGTITSGSESLSAAMSHEILEATINPYVNCWFDHPDGVREQCGEVCDPVQGNSYEIGGIAVSDFVGPRYFDSSPNAPGPYSRGGTVSPFEIDRNGYGVYRTGGQTGETSQVFGDLVSIHKQDQVTKYGRCA